MGATIKLIVMICVIVKLLIYIQLKKKNCLVDIFDPYVKLSVQKYKIYYKALQALLCWYNYSVEHDYFKKIDQKYFETRQEK